MMQVSSIKPNFCIPFRSQTVYYDNKVVVENAATLEKTKSYFSNPVTPNSNFVGFNLIRQDKNTIFIKSRYNHNIGTIVHGSVSTIPKMNIISGSHQPVIELVDEELGIKILVNRGSSLKSPNLNISYDKINEKKIYIDRYKNISFGNNLYLVTGYKGQKTADFARNYMASGKQKNVALSSYVNYIKNDYSIIGLAAGFGTRLKPISDLTDANKPTTDFPGGEKNLIEVSCLDTAVRGGKFQEITFLNEDEDNLSGTAGPIIKGLKNGTIPINKPLVLLTSDMFTNIDLAKVLYDYEQSKNTGIGVVVKNVETENLMNVPLVKIENNDTINKFYEKITADNYREIINQNKDFYTSTNIMIIHPKILEILKKFGDENGKGDFLEFLDLMLNILNKDCDKLNKKYPAGLGNKELKIEDLTGSYGYPKSVYNSNFIPLKVKAIYAGDIKGQNPYFADIGSIEKFIETARIIKESEKINGISKDFVKKVKENIDSSGVIFMQPSAKEKFERFKQKYNISKIEGNIIVSETSSKNSLDRGKFSEILKLLSKDDANFSQSDINELTAKNPQKFIEKIMEEPDKLKSISQEMINRYGLENFLKWYLSSDGYYGAYEEYVKNLYENATSIDELLKFSPNWSPWKLEEKFWRLNHPAYESYLKTYSEAAYKAQINNQREQPFTIGELPLYFSGQLFSELVHKIRNDNIEKEGIYIDGYYFYVEKLKGGELNDKNIYKITRYGTDYILKMDRSYAEDNDNICMYDKKTIKKNKVLMADSNFTNACVSRYLNLNGCKNVPKLFYYDFCEDAALYEYVQDVQGDLFQQGVIDTEYSDLNLSNDVVKNLREKGIYLNDTALKNFFTEKGGNQKIIDLGHANFFMPFKPGVKHYNIELANINGPDLKAIYASLL